MVQRVRPPGLRQKIASARKIDETKGWTRILKGKQVRHRRRVLRIVASFDNGAAKALLQSMSKRRRPHNLWQRMMDAGKIDDYMWLECEPRTGSRFEDGNEFLMQ